jgi:fatty-acyl-CoA synthase
MSKPEAGDRAGGGGLVRGAALAAGVALTLVGAGVVAVAPFLYRGGMVPLDTARTGLPGWAMMVFAVAAVASLVGFIASIAGKKHRGGIVAVLALIASGTALGTLYGQSVMRDALPPIYDVQTDWNNPVAFTEKALRQREAAGAVRVRDDAVIPEGSGKWSGMTFAEAQANSPYRDDLKPLIVKALPADATVAAGNAARRLGWTVVMSDPPGGQMEAEHQTQWYGLASDIAVRVTPEGAGSRIDVRSASRLSGGDLGVNANQVKALLDEIALMLR